MENKTRFQQILREWFETPAADTPLADPRQTSECLGVGTLVRAARGNPPLSPDQLDHVATCRHCQNAYARAVRLRQQGFSVNAEIQVPGTHAGSATSGHAEIASGVHGSAEMPVLPVPAPAAPDSGTEVAEPGAADRLPAGAPDERRNS
ncbi:MAG: hypothetical protein K0Q72_4184 [Armatimonadetes bacterium]|jgi:hypothetical protein|nr:hypothetical protein [Armatimonadota bacterium]